jgi:nitroreductase
MYKKTLISIVLILLLGTVVLKSQTVSNSVTDVIMKGYEPKVLTTKPVTDSEIDLIVKSGIKAPSARNSQLWKFTVLKDATLISEVIPNFTPGNVLVIVSGQEFPPEGSNLDIDCGLATGFMYVEAQSLGLGGHIYTAQVVKINSGLKSKLGIPEGYKAITLLRVGNFDNNVDAVSAASTRKKAEEVVNYK